MVPTPVEGTFLEHGNIAERIILKSLSLLPKEAGGDRRSLQDREMVQLRLAQLGLILSDLSPCSFHIPGSLGMLVPSWQTGGKRYWDWAEWALVHGTLESFLVLLFTCLSF